MTLLQLKPEFDWLTKVLISCKTEEQRKSAVRLLKNYIGRKGNEIDLFDSRGWENFKMLCNELIEVGKKVKSTIEEK